MTSEKRLIELDELLKFPIRIDHYDKEHGNENFVLGIETVLEYAEHLPTVDAVEVVHGRWEKSVVIQTDTSTLYNYTCSICSIVTNRESNYCPNCGAKMDGDGNG